MTRPFHGTRLALTAALVMFIAPSALTQAPGARRDAGRGVSLARNGQSATAPAATPDAKQLATALVEFEKRLKGYLALREELERSLKPLSPTANSADLATRQSALAAALR